MPHVPAVVANHFRYKSKMPKLIIHTEADLQAINDRRLEEIFSLSYVERMKKAYHLMSLSIKFKKSALKQPQGLGVLLKRKK